MYIWFQRLIPLVFVGTRPFQRLDATRENMFIQLTSLIPHVLVRITRHPASQPLPEREQVFPQHYSITMRTTYLWNKCCAFLPGELRYLYSVAALTARRLHKVSRKPNWLLFSHAPKAYAVHHLRSKVGTISSFIESGWKSCLPRRDEGSSKMMLVRDAERRLEDSSKEKEGSTNIEAKIWASLGI